MTAPERIVERKHVCDFAVMNPAVIDRTVEEVLRPHRDPGFVVSRIQDGGTSEIVRGDTRLEQQDIVVAVGDDDGLLRAEQIFGQPLEAHIEQDRSQLDFRRVFVSRQEIVGKRIRELDLENSMGATVTRLRRGDVDFIPTRDTRLELGDRVRVLTRRENFPAISQFFGGSIRGTAETDFGSVARGMVLGVLVGLVPIPLPGPTIRLGFAGGPLLVAVVLGKLEPLPERGQELAPTWTAGAARMKNYVKRARAEGFGCKMSGIWDAKTEILASTIGERPHTRAMSRH